MSMQFRELGTSGIKVSQLCLGTMTFGEQNTPEEAFAQMDYAMEKGINFLDTAELYSIPPRAETYGRTEEIVGDWMAQRKNRKNIVIATKIVGPAPNMPWIREGRSVFSRADITAASEASLKRLKTDYIDLYQIHWPRRPVNTFGKLGFEERQVSGRESDEILEALEGLAELVKSGKVRALGLSNETPWGLMTFLKHHAVKGLPRVVSIQNPYNLLNRSFEVGLAEMAMQEKVGLLAYAPLAAGTLTGKYLDGKLPPRSRRALDHRPSRYKKPKEEEAVRAYLNVAKKHEMDAAQMALAFVNTRPFLTANILGATSVEQLKVNIAALGIDLPAEVVADINAVHATISNPCP